MNRLKHNETTTILIVDLCDWEGHHRVYICSMVQLLLKMGFRVSVLSCFPDEALKEMPLGVDVLSLSGTRSALERVLYWSITTRDRFVHRFRSANNLNAWAGWQLLNIFQLRRVLRDIKAEYPKVVMLDIGSMTPSIPPWLLKFLWPSCLSGLLIQAPLDQTARLELLNKWPDCATIFSLDERFVKFSRRYSSKRNIFYIPELVDNPGPITSRLAEQIKIKARGRKIIGLYGNLSKRSNVQVFLEAVQYLSAQDFFFFVIGRVQPGDSDEKEITLAIKVLADKLCDFYADTSTHLSDQDFLSLSQLCDIHYLVYPDFDHSSHRLSTVSLLDKPVIVAEKTLMSERVEKFGLGMSVPPDDVMANARAIAQLAYDGWNSSRNLGRWKRMHSKDVFISRLMSKWS